LQPITDVRGYMFTDRPLLAADPALAPWPTPSDLEIMQTGAWMQPDERPLPRDVEEFLAAGEPPIYFGFGSTHTSQETGRAAFEAVTALGCRAIVSAGWADLALVDDRPECLSVTEVNLQALFPRVVAVVHHGGAGTTTSALLAGTAQVVVPHMYDQHYFARRVEALRIGVAHPSTTPTTGSLIAALKQVLQPKVTVRAKLLAGTVRMDGAAVAAEYVTR
jgi:vancomycin aglycone glucosyltransferase